MMSLALATVAALAVVDVANAQGSISGRVVNSATGAPVRRAEVSIAVDGRRDVWGTSPTDGDGRFVCRSLPAGRYRLGAAKNGYAAMDYGATRPFMSGRVVVLALGEQKRGVDIQLPQLAVITGTVTDVDGTPAPRVGVQPLRREFQRGKAVWTQAGWANTDSEGHYRLFHMMPGKYLVTAKKSDQPQPPPESPGQEGSADRLAYMTTFYPGTLERQQAGQVVVGPGETVENIDIPLMQSRPVVLEVGADLPVPAPQPVSTDQPAADGRPVPPPNPPNQFVQLSLVEKNSGGANGGQFGGGFPIGSRSTFNDLQPGRYVLTGETSVDGRLYAAREELDLAGGSASVTLRFAPAVDLAGHVRVEAAAVSAAGGRVFLVDGDGSNRQGAEAHVLPDGSYVLKNVPPGVWDIGFDPVPKGGYLKSMMLGDVDVLRADMNVTAETKGPLEIVVSAAGVQLSGKVEGGLARAVLAAPQGELAGVLSFYALATVDEQGAFHMDSLTPGEYRVYAFEDLAQGAWFDPDFLKPYAERGTPVELQAGSKMEVTVQAIGAEVVR